MPALTQTMDRTRAITQIIDDIKAAHRNMYGAQYIIRLSQTTKITPTTSGFGRLSYQLAYAPIHIPDCRLILSNPRSSGAIGTADAASRHRLAEAGWKIRIAPASALLHAKGWLVDRRWLWIGSHNTAEKNWETNEELSLRTGNDAAIRQFLTWYTQLWQRSTPI